MNDESDRQLIDEKGRLFGLVNIVDVLVLVLVLALVVGGIAVVMSLDSDPVDQPADEPDVINDTRFVTLEFGTQPPYIADRMGADIEADAFEHEDVTITDVYRSGHVSGNTVVVARARIDGTTNETTGVFRFDGEPLRLGQQVSIERSTIAVTGMVTAIDESGDSLQVSRSRVTVGANVSSPVAESVTVGDEYSVAGEAIATIESVEVQELDAPHRDRLEVDIELLVIQRGASVEFAGRTLRVGTTIPFYGERYEFQGEVVSIQN